MNEFLETIFDAKARVCGFSNIKDAHGRIVGAEGEYIWFNGIEMEAVAGKFAVS